MGLRIISISLSGFRSFAEDQSLKFPATGLVSLVGMNMETGGGSGSGKSNLLTAIAYALGFSPLPYTELQSWTSTAPATATLKLETDRGLVSITRGKTLKVSVDGVKVEGSISQKEERLKEILGLDPDMLKALTYRGQRQPGLFLSKTDTKKKEFLMQLLDLEKFEVALEVGAANVKTAEAAVSNAEAVLAKIVAQIAELLEADMDAAKAALDGAQARLETAKTREMVLSAECEALTQKAALAELAIGAARKDELETAKANLKTVTATKPEADASELAEFTRLTKLADECQARMAKLEAAASKERAGLEKQKTDLNEDIQALSRELGQVDGLVREKSRLSLEISKLDSNTCPTCDRQWDQAQAKRVQLSAELGRCDDKLTALAVTRDAQNTLTAKLKAIPPYTPNPMLLQLTSAREQATAAAAGEKQRLKSSLALLQSEHARQIAEAESLVGSIRTSIEEAKAAIRLEMTATLTPLREQLDAIDTDDLWNVFSIAQSEVTRADTLLKQRHGLQLDHFNASIRRDAATANLYAERDFLQLIGREGFLGSIFDEVLAEISNETNQILGSVANTRHCTLNFRSESVTEKGTVKKSIVPVVSVGGHEASLASGLSGGMLSAVELAVDLAVGETIRRRTGACPGWLILDESFEGLGPVEKESCMEILQTYARDRLVLVVDHASEFKSLFSQTIVVQYANGVSSISQELN